MNKEERRILIAKLVEDGLKESSVVETVMNDADVSENTVKRDIKALYPDGFPAKGDKGVDELQKAQEEIKRLKASMSVRESGEETIGRVVDVKEYVKNIADNERDVLHVEMEKVNFNRFTGKKVSRPSVKKFDRYSWETVRKNAKAQGWNHIKVLFAPEGVETEL